MTSEDLKIYRDFSLERLGKDACTNFLQNLARSNGHISSNFCLSGAFPDSSARYMSMFFRLYFLSQKDLDKFHSLGMITTDIQQVSLSFNKDLKSLNLSGGEAQAIVLYAFRYCLTRCSYAVGDMCDFLRNRGQELDKYTKDLIIKEIKETIERDNKGIEEQNFLMSQGEEEWEANRFRVFMSQDRYNWESTLKVLDICIP